MNKESAYKETLTKLKQKTTTYLNNSTRGVW